MPNSLNFLSIGYFEVNISDFRVSTQNNTHITFSWTLPPGISSISYFDIYYLDSISTSNSYSNSHYFNEHSDGLTAISSQAYVYTVTTSSFYHYGEYLMWLYVSTSIGVLNSKQITVQKGKSVFRQPIVFICQFRYNLWRK